MKVLMLGWELPPHNSGGLGVACYQLCKALAKNNVDIEFILPYEANEKYDFMRVTAAYPQDVSQIFRAGTTYESFKYVFKDGNEAWLDIVDQQRLYEESVIKIIETKEFDIIHAHDWLTFRAGIRAKQQSGMPLIVHVHSIETDRAGGSKGNPIVREIEALGLILADQIVAISQRTKDEIIREYAIPADKIVVLHNSIDRDELGVLDDVNAYHYLHLQTMKAKEYHVVASVGRLTIQKGLTNLLRAAQKVVERLPKTILLVVGSGEQYHELIELAAELGISRNVVFAGFQRGKPLRDAFGIADIFVMPSISEPFGITPLEAINYGTPSLISYQSGVSEVLQNCLKVDFWDVDEMANQITAVLQSPALHDDLRDNAASELAKMSWQQSADALHSLYKKHAGVRS